MSRYNVIVSKATGGSCEVFQANIQAYKRELVITLADKQAGAPTLKQLQAANKALTRAFPSWCLKQIKQGPKNGLLYFEGHQ